LIGWRDPLESLLGGGRFPLMTGAQSAGGTSLERQERRGRGPHAATAGAPEVGGDRWSSRAARGDRWSSRGWRRRGQAAKSRRPAAAQQEGAFRFVRNPNVSVAALALSSHEACPRRRERESTFFGALDQSSPGVTDGTANEDFGPVGCRGSQRRRGVQAMTTLAASGGGPVLGVCRQRWWRRSGEKSPEWKRDRRPLEERVEPVAERTRGADARTSPLAPESPTAPGHGRSDPWRNHARGPAPVPRDRRAWTQAVPKSRSAASRLCARQRRVRLSFVVGPPSACARRW
jgi:hypothetical protein